MSAAGCSCICRAIVKAEYEDRNSPFSNNHFRVFGLQICSFRNSDTSVDHVSTKKAKGVSNKNPTLVKFSRDCGMLWCKLTALGEREW